MRRRTHSGFTLVEVTVAIAMGAALLATLGIVVQKLMFAAAASQSYREETTIASRLAEQYRGDVRRSISAELDSGSEPSKRLLLRASDGTMIKYELTDEGARRTETVTSQAPVWELYALSRPRIVGWRRASAGEPSMLGPNRRIEMLWGFQAGQDVKPFVVLGVLMSGGDRP